MNSELLSQDIVLGRPRMILIKRYLKIFTFLSNFVGFIVFFEINCDKKKLF